MPLPKCVRSEVPPGKGWREIGWFVTYQREPMRGGLRPSVRRMEHWEPPVIKAICEHFEHDRMHMDSEVSEEDADEFKKGFLDNALANEWPVFTCGQPQTIGFLIVRPEGKIAHIDLIGVHPEHRHVGVASYLVAHFLGWSYMEKFDLCRAGTMEANGAACSLYESGGFKVAERTRIWHL